MWFLLAIGSAIFAALTSILAKIGIEGVGSNLATAIRTMVVVIMAWGMVFITHQQAGIKDISQKCWIFDFPDSVRPCYWCFMALLLQGPADGRRFKSRPD